MKASIINPPPPTLSNFFERRPGRVQQVNSLTSQSHLQNPPIFFTHSTVYFRMEISSFYHKGGVAYNVSCLVGGDSLKVTNFTRARRLCPSLVRTSLTFVTLSSLVT